MSEKDTILALTQLFLDRTVETVSFGRVHEERFSQEGRRLRLPFTGPLRYRNSVRIDLSFREDIILEIRKRAVLHKYGEPLSTKLKVLDFTEIMAEKLRALMERGYPRDYYEVWYHIDQIQDKTTLKQLTARKCTLLSLEYNPSRIFDESVLERVESLWKTQLQHLIPNYLDFRDILPELKAKLNFL
jgi:predicted nucleotidyltransferase component of viral defense system